MPTSKTRKTSKTSKTTKTTSTFVLRNSYGKRYYVRNGELVEAYHLPYKMKLTEIVDGHRGVYTITSGETSGYSYGTHLAYVNIVNGRPRKLNIGCQTFVGKNATYILAHAKRAQNKLTKAATAGK